MKGSKLRLADRNEINNESCSPIGRRRPLGLSLFQTMEQNTNEEWKDVAGYDGYYQVSNKGNVKSVDRQVPQINNNGETYIRLLKGKILKPRVQNGGYLVVWLCKLGVCKAVTVHRLVAQAFVPNSLGLKDINHINGVKIDNHVENIEWCTRSENIKHSYSVLKHRHWRTSVKCIENNTVYDSISYASKCLGIRASGIGNNINGRTKSVNGLHFVKINEYIS